MLLHLPPRASRRIRHRRLSNEISLPSIGAGQHSCSAFAVGLLWLLNAVYRAVKARLLNAQSDGLLVAGWRQGVDVGAASAAWELTPSRAGHPGRAFPR